MHIDHAVDGCGVLWVQAIDELRCARQLFEDDVFLHIFLWRKPQFQKSFDIEKIGTGEMFVQCKGAVAQLLDRFETGDAGIKGAEDFDTVVPSA